MRWLTLLFAASLAHAGPTQGFRNDGTGVWSSPTAPQAWSPTEGLLWSTKLAAWSNASPIFVGDQVCACEEPTTLVCVRRDTGAVTWRAAHPVVDAVPPEQRAGVQAANARRDALEAELTTSRRQYSQLLRVSRAGGDASATDTLVAMAARIDTIKAELNTLPEYRTPPNQNMIGWSSPTPATDGARVFGLWSNGVVAGHSAKGDLLWSRWLGPMASYMVGWDEGHAASPLVVDGVLIVPFRTLQGLDPATGRTLWEAGDWPHYGGPVPMTIDGTAVLLTPDGRAVRVRDGRVVATGLADVWYISAVTEGRRAFFLEARSGLEITQRKGMALKAWQLGPLTGDTLTTTPLWTIHLPAAVPAYAAPVAHGDHLYVATHDGTVFTLEAATGALLSTVQPQGLGPTSFYASPTIVGDHLYLTDERGITLVMRTGPKPEVVSVNKLWPTRASPAVRDGVMMVRTENHLVAIGAP